MITIEKPTIESNSEKPIPFANQGFPYNHISSDRRFEELVYSIYKKKTENDPKWIAKYDDIMLMQGVGEKGRDCVLYNKGNIIGAIQSKKYNQRITQPDCAKEIIKFVLYSIVDTRLIQDVNQFNYYFVAAAGFTEPAVFFLDNFKTEIKNEPSLEKCFNDLIKEYKSLGKLKYTEVSAELLKKLTTINIIKVLPQELDIELQSSYCKEIVPLFFEVKVVLDSNSIDELRTLLEEKTTNPPINITYDEIQAKFRIASLQLGSYRSHLYNLPDSHIPRAETTNILAWLKNPILPKSKPIFLLVGNSGYGKSVILKDVYTQLVAENIPVLGIKSDRYYVHSISELSEKMNLKFSPVELIKESLKTQPSAVVLIDQIDSLSQSITSKRDYIDTYQKLLNELMEIKGVRIIISIRTFDLIYDFEFSEFKGFNTLIVPKLTKAQLKSILENLGIDVESISPTLLELLLVPNQLDIFCKIYSSNLNINSLKTIQDLYNELWKQKVEVNEGLDISLYEVAEKMHQQQVLSISPGILSSDSRNSLSYLESNGLITTQENELQFFHQSFYDYSFSKAFVNKNNSLYSYILQQNQSIYIRPALKMILTFMRERDLSNYLQTIERLLFSKTIRFHLQLLVINQLGFENRPLKKEIDFVTTKILFSRKYKIPFLEAAIGDNWLRVLIEGKHLDPLLLSKQTFFKKLLNNKAIKFFLNNSNLKLLLENFSFQKRKEHSNNLWFSILRRALPTQRIEILKYLTALNNSYGKQNEILRLLWGLKVWDSPLAFELLEKTVTDKKNEYYIVLNLLLEALDYNYDWVLLKFKKFFFDSINNEGVDISMLNHHKIELLKKLFKVNSEKTFEFGIQSLKTIIQNSLKSTEIDPSFLYEDSIYYYYDLDRDHITSYNEMLFQLMLDNCAVLAQNNSNVFSNFINSSINENSTTILKIALTGMAAEPSHNLNNIIKILKSINEKGGFDSSLKYFIRNLLEASYSYFDNTQKTKVNKLILKIIADNEIGYVEREGNKKFYSCFGLLKFEYLSSIPNQILFEFPEMKRVYQELQRKYKKSENIKVGAFHLHRVGPPIDEKAYEKMSLDQWENSFYKFSKDYHPGFDSEKGGLLENHRKFEEKVTQSPHFFLPLIEKIINENKVNHDYIVAGLNGLSKSNFSPEYFITQYKKVLKLPINDFITRQIVWLSDYIIKNKLIDKEILDFLCNVAINDSDPKKSMNPDNPKFETLNSNRGSAADAIVKCSYDSNFSDKIFVTLNQVANDPINSVKISALMNLAVLMNLDKEKCLNLFLKFLRNTKDKDVYKYSIDSAQYLARYNFEALNDYFNEAIEIEEVQDQIAQILAIGWLNNKKNSYTLLKKVWTKNIKAKAKMASLAIVNLQDKNGIVRKKCIHLYCKFIQESNNEIVQEYSRVFVRLNPHKFLLYLPLLKKYSTSVAAKKDPHSYYDYLIKCSKYFPGEVLDLVKKYKKYDLPNSLGGPYYDGSEPTKIIIGSYNGIYEKSPFNKRYARKALYLFDQMLKEPVFRSGASQVLDSI